MSPANEIRVPDIGDFKDVPVIEIFVKVGDVVKAEDALVSLESDKATMDVPAPRGGKVKSIAVQVGDKVSEGSVIMAFEGEGLATAAAPAEAAKPSVSAPPSAVNAPAGVADVRVPDIGDFRDVPVIEIFVKVGDAVKAEDPLISLESDKATMDVPAPLSGVVQSITVSVGDKVSEGFGDPVADYQRRVGRGTADGRVGRNGRRRSGCVSARCRRRLRRSRVPRSPTPARRYASSPASSASTWARSRAAATTAASSATTSRPSPRVAALLRQRRCRRPQRRQPVVWASAASSCWPGRRSTFPSSAPSSARKCPGSRRSRAPTCTATGS
jgi:pyruvate/2-oxoglutarate dehydrogenase complex dihydrolipoamide acyltransferase (E2) component